MAGESIILPANLLTDEHLQQMKNAMDVAALIQNHIDMAKRAGIDVSSQEKELAETIARIRAIRNTYFPGR